MSFGFWLFCDIRKNKLLGEWELPDGAVVLGRVPYLAATQRVGSGRFFQRGLVTASVAVIVVGIGSVATYLIWIGH